jgi:hypothetical protein
MMVSSKKEITRNTKGITRDYFEKLYSNKLKNIEKIDKFVHTYDHLKLNHEDINHLNRSITCNESEAAEGNTHAQEINVSQLPV